MAHFITFLLQLLPSLTCLLFLLWFVGVKLKVVAIVLLIAFGSIFILVKRRTLPEFHLSESHQSVILGFLILFPALNFALQLSYIALGEMGIDFSIFTQAVRSASVGDGLLVSLVSEQWVGFLSHHFSPILYLPGILTKLAPDYIALLLFNTGCISLTLIMLFLIGRELGFHRGVSLFLIAIFCINPWFLKPISWGVHVELMSLPCVAGSFLFWLRRKYITTIFCILFSCLFKETLFFYAVGFGIFALIDTLVSRDSHKRKLALTVAATSCVVGLSMTIWYLLLRPESLGSSFNPFSRVSAFSELLSPETLSLKTHYILLFFTHVLFLPFVFKRNLHFLVPALPALLTIFLSNFHEMAIPYSYYGTLPALIAYIAFMKSLGELKLSGTRIMQVLFCALCLQLSLESYRPMKIIKSASKVDWRIPYQMEMLPPSARVIASDYDTLYILDKKHPIRLWRANRLETTWDFILSRPDPKEEIGERLLSGATRCFEDKLWVIYCNKDSSLQIKRG